MSYQLVVSEKPSVGAAYAKVLGATNRQDGYLEGNGYLVSWCVGHLVELAPPNIYDARYVKWSIADLPILPQKWQYLVSASTKKQFGILQKLMNRPDVDGIVNSCDSGREGELIFRLVYQQAGCKKPFSRLWLSSMEENAIREGFAHLKPSTEYDALYNAALCRERADWMVGINASRLFSCLYSQPLAVGRVMTPVLAMTVVREAAIAVFTPEKFYTVALTLADGGTASSKRFAQKADAELLLSKCRKEGRVTVQKMERKEKSESPPQLYDLTALQRDANRLLGFTAQQTLDYAQSLYEKRLITYPRTDSRFLTEDMAASLPGLVTDTGRAFAVEEPLPIHVQQVINGSKVTDHHALLPTKSMAKADLAALPAGERNILRLIAARLLCAVGEPHRYAETTLTTICAGEEFSAKGKMVLSEGWKAMERKMLGELLGKQKEVAALPDVQEQSQCSVAGAELKEGQTSPPKSYTEDTLLSAMQAAGADSMPEGVERQGIGTPATRAATIEKLVQKGFLERKGTKKTKVLLPTDKGKALITVMPEEIQSPEMTADWETKLLQIERSEMEPETFMTEIKEMISSLVTTTEAAKGANVVNNFEGLTSISGLQSEMQEAVHRLYANGEGDKVVTERFEVIEQVHDCRVLFEQLQASLSSGWEHYFSEASIYYAEHGNLNVPKLYTTPGGLSLGVWLVTQRRVREGQIQGNLTEQQIARLDSIGMVWGNRKEIAWQHGFEVAKKYHDTYGNLMVPGKYVDPDGYPLGQWIIKTRQQKLNGRLKEERIAQLDEIGMVWNIFDAKWEKAYALAAAYYEENGNLNIPRSYVTAAGERLGQWVASQQWAYPKGKLTDEQVERLNRIGMYWGNRNDRQWNEGYQEAKRYFDAHGDLNVPAEYVSPGGYNLGNWVKRQRYTRHNPEKSCAVLTEERIAKLDTIGMRWEKSNPKRSSGQAVQAETVTAKAG